MLKTIRNIILTLTGLRPVLNKIISSTQAAVRVIEMVKQELVKLELGEQVLPTLDLVIEWMNTIISIITKVLSITIGETPVIASSSDPVEELKRQLDLLKS